jgi:hypothetical protein
MRLEVAPEAFGDVMAHLERLGSDAWGAFFGAYATGFDVTEYPRDYVSALFTFSDTREVASALCKRLENDEDALIGMLGVFDNLLGHRSLYRCISNIMMQNERVLTFPFETFPEDWDEVNWNGDYYLRLFFQLIDFTAHTAEVKPISVWPESLQAVFDDADRIMEGMAFLGALLRGHQVESVGA